MFGFTAMGFVIIILGKWFWAIATGKNDSETSQLFRIEKPKNHSMSFFHLKRLIYHKANV